MEQGARMNKALMRGKCKNQTKAPKRSVKGLKRAFDARLRGVLPAFAGTFEPKWVGMWVRCKLLHQYSAQS
ncbi:Group II intron reverse transcriptase/maturase [Pseudomonas sp. IT-P171]